MRLSSAMVGLRLIVENGERGVGAALPPMGQEMPADQDRIEQPHEHQPPAIGEMPQGVVAHLSTSCGLRSEEHTSELQSLMRSSYAVFCLKKKNKTQYHRLSTHTIAHTTHSQSYIQPHQH